jgi:hypothetical protein
MSVSNDMSLSNDMSFTNDMSISNVTCGSATEEVLACRDAVGGLMLKSSRADPSGGMGKDGHAADGDNLSSLLLCIAAALTVFPNMWLNEDLR